MGRSTRSKPQPFPFQALPVEIRYLIYDFVFESEEHDIKLMMNVHPFEDWRQGKDWVSDNQWEHHQAISALQHACMGPTGRFAYQQGTPSILLACKVIYKEAAPIFHRCRTLYFGGPKDLVSTLRSASDEQIAQVHRVRLMQRRYTLKRDSGFGYRPIHPSSVPNGDVSDWGDLTIPVLSECRNLKHFTMDLGFFWPSMEQSDQLKAVRQLRGLQTMSFLGNDGQLTRIPKWDYVLNSGVRQDLRAHCAARQLPEFQFYEVNPSWLQSIKDDTMQERRNDYDFRRRFRLSL